MEIREEIIQEVKELHAKYGTVRMRDYEDEGKYSIHQIRKHFKTWNGLLEEAELKANVHFNATKDDVIKDMLRLHKEHGKLTARIQREHSKYSQAVIDRLFGSFGKMMKELNIRTQSSGKRYTNEELLERLRTTHNQYGYIDSTLVEACGDASIQTYCNRFKTLPMAAKEAGLIYGDISSASVQSRKVIQRMATILGEQPHIEFTFDWLRNPKTGMPLAVDAYFEKANLIVEYHGEYHYKHIPHLQSTMTLAERQKLDRYKEEEIRKRGYYYIAYPYSESKAFETVFRILKKETKFTVVT